MSSDGVCVNFCWKRSIPAFSPAKPESLNISTKEPFAEVALAFKSQL